MDPSFHILNLSANRNLTTYQPQVYRTIARHVAHRLLMVLLVAAGIPGAPCSLAQTQPGAVSGFAPPQQNLLAPLLRLAPAGQAARALQTFDRIHALDRKLILHPLFSPQLQRIIDHLPEPELIPIEMPTLYTSSKIPWRTDSADGRYLAVDGRPDGANYLYRLLQSPSKPQQPGQFGGLLTIRPARGPAGQTPASVIAGFNALLYLSGLMTPASGLESALGFQREIDGTMAPPWDEKPGVFNQHDQAFMARLQRDLPATAQRLNHYLNFYNILDEFSSPSGPWVLVNVEAEVREDALAPYPYLRTFWREVAGYLDVQTVVRDAQGRRWFVTGIHQGVITLAFILRNGMPAPMDAAMRPAGPSLDLGELRAGHCYLESTIAMERFGMRLGLSHIRFAIGFANRGGTIELISHMAGVPALIAPPLIHPLTILLAGQYLHTIAQGNGGEGIATAFSASAGPQGGTMLSGSISAELLNAPTLELLARIASALAPDYGRQVREEQRRLAAEFFDAFDSDYRRAKPGLLGTTP